MFASGGVSTMPATIGPWRRIRQALTLSRRPALSSLLGVLAITLILFFTVAFTARLILGR